MNDTGQNRTFYSYTFAFLDIMSKILTLTFLWTNTHDLISDQNTVRQDMHLDGIHRQIITEGNKMGQIFKKSIVLGRVNSFPYYNTMCYVTFIFPCASSTFITRFYSGNGVHGTVPMRMLLTWSYGGWQSIKTWWTSAAPLWTTTQEGKCLGTHFSSQFFSFFFYQPLGSVSGLMVYDPVIISQRHTAKYA